MTVLLADAAKGARMRRNPRRASGARPFRFRSATSTAEIDLNQEHPQKCRPLGSPKRGWACWLDYGERGQGRPCMPFDLARLQHSDEREGRELGPWRGAQCGWERPDSHRPAAIRCSDSPRVPSGRGGTRLGDDRPHERAVKVVGPQAERPGRSRTREPHPEVVGLRDELSDLVGTEGGTSIFVGGRSHIVEKGPGSGRRSRRSFNARGER